MPQAYAETPVGVIDGANITFALVNPPFPTNSLQLYLNGLLQRQGADYNLSGATITFIAVPQIADILEAFYVYGVPSSSTSISTATELQGSDLLTMMLDRLGGYANAFSADTLLDFLNEGKDAVWSALKSLNENFFQRSSQYTDNTQGNYFGPLDPTIREYELPSDFRAMRFIECVTNGFASVRFLKRNMNTEEWKQARRASNDPINSTIGTAQFEYLYDIVESDAGGFEIILAQFPSTNLQLVVWYLRGLPDFEAGDSINQILRPYSKKIVTFAVERAMLVLQDETMSEQWMIRWKEDVIGVSQAAGPVNQVDPTYVQDFQG